MTGAPTDHLANERTFLAWVRTAITIMAFGFVIARFGRLIRYSSGLGAASSSSSPPASLADGVGVFLVLAGTAILAVSLLRYVRTRADLLAGRFESRIRVEWALTGLLIAVGLGLAAYLIIEP